MGEIRYQGLDTDHDLMLEVLATKIGPFIKD
jgi:hypothetical protein